MKCPKYAHEVEVHDDASGYYRYIGSSNNGKRRWRLGKDRSLAQVKAQEIWKDWESRDADIGTWEDWDNRKFERLMKEGEFDESKATAAKVVQQRQRVREIEVKILERHRDEVDVAQITIEEAKTRYLAYAEKRVGIVGGIEDWTVKQLKHKLGRAVELLPDSVNSPMKCPSVPEHLMVSSSPPSSLPRYLHELDRQRLRDWVMYMASRPSKKANPKATKETKAQQVTERVSAKTCCGWIQEVKTFLLWCADEGIYELPKHVKEIWNVRPEPEEQTVRVITRKELRQLWNGCINENAYVGDKGESRKLWIMLGLNCGFYTVDIATLVEANVNGTHITKLRRKTRKTNAKLVKYRWKLWPETKELLSKYMPLKTNVNSIRKAFERLINSTKLDNSGISHSNLRDTGASWVQNHSGSRELADCYLAHSRRGVIDNYALPMFNQLDVELDAFYEQFVKPALGTGELPD